jgi:hypothetical protein
MVLSNKSFRNLLLIAYLLLVIPYSIYKFSTSHINSVISEGGHLRWNFFYLPPFFIVVWLFFFLISFVCEKKWFGLFFALIILIIAFINYNKDNTMWSMWCWGINSAMIYYSFYLLIFLPFSEKMSIC